MVMIRIGIILSVLFFSGLVAAENLRIAASANFAKPLEMLIAEFQKQHPFTPQLSIASTGVLYQQIRHGAPFDILFAADIRRPELLEQQGLIYQQYRKTYALGQLALWTPNQQPEISLESLKGYNGRLAIAAPHIAPYGRATKEALMSVNLWKKFHNKLITGNNINQTLQQTMTGAVSYGFIAASQFLDTQKGSGVIIDSQLHAPLEQQMVVLKNADNIELAEKFFEFVLSLPAQDIISKAGYLPAVYIAADVKSQNKEGAPVTTEKNQKQNQQKQHSANVSQSPDKRSD